MADSPSVFDCMVLRQTHFVHAVLQALRALAVSWESVLRLRGSIPDTFKLSAASLAELDAALAANETAKLPLKVHEATVCLLGNSLYIDLLPFPPSAVRKGLLRFGLVDSCCRPC